MVRSSTLYVEVSSGSRVATLRRSHGAEVVMAVYYSYVLEFSSLKKWKAVGGQLGYGSGVPQRDTNPVQRTATIVTDSKKRPISSNSAARHEAVQSANGKIPLRLRTSLATEFSSRTRTRCLHSITKI